MVCESHVYKAVLKKSPGYPIFEETYFFSLFSKVVYSSLCYAVAFGKQLALGLFILFHFSVRINPAYIS